MLFGNDFRWTGERMRMWRRCREFAGDGTFVGAYDGAMERIVRMADRPNLVPVVAGWLWDIFWRQGGYTLDQIAKRTS